MEFTSSRPCQDTHELLLVFKTDFLLMETRVFDDCGTYQDADCCS